MIGKRFFFFLVFLTVSGVTGNPVMPRYINEFQIGPDGWILELHAIYGGPVRLDNCFLASRSDTAFFLSSIELHSGSYIIITPDSLDHPLSIRSSGDTLLLYDSVLGGLDSFEFSTDPGECSLNRRGSYFLYLDSTPTLGFPNDTSGAMGWVCGTVSDEKGIPIADVSIDWEYSGGEFHSGGDKSDAFGHYQLRTLAGLIYLWLHREGYQSMEKRVTMYPDSTIIQDALLRKNPDSVEENEEQSIIKFSISGNYPNPFNSVTRFQYSIPSDGFTDIEVFDVRGKSVETLFHGFQKRGEYRLFWDAFEAPSGIYFCRIQSGNAVLVKKWILIR